MPEMPEMEALTRWLRGRVVGHCFTRVELAALNALKTVAMSPRALLGLEITEVRRDGKFCSVGTPGAWLTFHLARAGWLRWYESAPAAPARPGKSPLALRVALDDGSGFDLTEMGTQKKLAVYFVADPHDVPMIASLGDDPLAPGFGRDRLDEILRVAGRAQLKGVLRDQRVFAGIGNAYSGKADRSSASERRGPKQGYLGRAWYARPHRGSGRRLCESACVLETPSSKESVMLRNKNFAAMVLAAATSVWCGCRRSGLRTYW